MGYFSIEPLGRWWWNSRIAMCRVFNYFGSTLRDWQGHFRSRGYTFERYFAAISPHRLLLRALLILMAILIKMPQQWFFVIGDWRFDRWFQFLFEAAAAQFSSHSAKRDARHITPRKIIGDIASLASLMRRFEIFGMINFLSAYISCSASAATCHTWRDDMTAISIILPSELFYYYMHTIYMDTYCVAGLLFYDRAMRIISASAICDTRRLTYRRWRGDAFRFFTKYDTTIIWRDVIILPFRHAGWCHFSRIHRQNDAKLREPGL